MINYLNVFSAIISFFVNIIFQVACFRFIKGLTLLKSVFCGFIAGICALLFFDFFESLASSAVNIIIYVNLSYCYFHFINLGETARRIRILTELIESKNGLKKEEILKRYNAGEILERRLERLIDNGQLVCKNNRYFIGNPIFLFIARLITALKIITLGKKSEFQ